MFDFDPPQPVASASIGQVYRATLRATGKRVAVKVQRPDARQTAPLDMFILRKVAAFVKKKKVTTLALALALALALTLTLTPASEPIRTCARISWQ